MEKEGDGERWGGRIAEATQLFQVESGSFFVNVAGVERGNASS